MATSIGFLLSENNAKAWASLDKAVEALSCSFDLRSSIPVNFLIINHISAKDIWTSRAISLMVLPCW